MAWFPVFNTFRTESSTILPFVNSSSQQSGRLHPQASRATIRSWVESKQVTRSYSFGRQFHRNVLTREVSSDSVLDTRAGNARPRVYDRDVIGSRRFRQRRRRVEEEEKPRRLVRSIDNPFPFLSTLSFHRAVPKSTIVHQSEILHGSPRWAWDPFSISWFSSHRS